MHVVRAGLSGVIVMAVTLTAASAWAEREVKLERSKLSVRIPDDWVVKVEDSRDIFEHTNGGRIGRLHMLRVDCANFLSQFRAVNTEPIVDRVPAVAAGWSGLMYQVRNLFSTEPEVGAAYCRDFVVRGSVYSLVVESTEHQVGRLVAVIEAAMKGRFGGQVASTTAAGTTSEARPMHIEERTYRERRPKPGPLARFRPRRYELGLAILDVGTDDFFTSERGTGASLEIARPLYGRGLALGYRARVQPTSSGFAGFGEVGAGLTFKLFSVLAIAGVGGAGESAPFGLHYGGQADVLLPLSTYGGIEGSVTRAWCDEGDIWRFDGRFVVRTSLINPRVYTVGIGWETRVDSRIITINLGTLVLPGL